MRRERRDKPMHRTSITDAALIEAVLFSTVFRMPADEPMIWQVIEVLLMLGILIYMIECARKWEKKLRKERKRNDCTESKRN